VQPIYVVTDGSSNLNPPTYSLYQIVNPSGGVSYKIKNNALDLVIGLNSNYVRFNADDGSTNNLWIMHYLTAANCSVCSNGFNLTVSRTICVTTIPQCSSYSDNATCLNCSSGFSISANGFNCY
jgi:hypothetical protein